MAGPPWAAKAAKDVGAKLAASEESSGVLTLQRWGHPPTGETNLFAKTLIVGKRASGADSELARA